MADVPTDKPPHGSALDADEIADSTVVQVGRDIHGGVTVNATTPSAAAVSVTIAPPFGRRDPSRPLRGRDELLEALAARRRGDPATGAESRVQVLHGLAGCGKTAIALELCRKAADDESDVWWVSGGDAAALTAGMRAVARRTGVSEEELRHGDTADVLWRRLETHPRPWLLVVDNADDLALLGPEPGDLPDGRGWVRPFGAGRGLVIVTTRDGDPAAWGSWCDRHHVRTLAVPDATLVLLDHVGELAGPAEEAAALAERVQCLPLALRLAGAYLADTARMPWPADNAITTFAVYRAAIEAGRTDIFDHAHGDSVIDRAWQVSLDLLDRRGLDQARPLLGLLSSFGDAAVPYQRLLRPATMATSALFTGLDGTRLWTLLKALAGLGLIDLAPPAEPGDGRRAQPLLRVHPLVRDASRGDPRGDGEDRPAQLSLLATLLDEYCDPGTIGPPEWPPGWPDWLLVVPHALHARRAVSADADSLRTDLVERVTNAAHLAVRHLRARGQYLLAEREYRTILGLQTAILGEEHPLTLATQHSLGGVLHDLGRYDDAAAQWRTVLCRRRRTLGEDDPQTLFTRHGYALVLRDLGEFDRAGAEWKAVLNHRRRVLGDAHPHTLATRHCLAGLLRHRGQHDEAEAEYRAILATQERTLGRDHPDTLATLHTIADILDDQGDLRQAETMYRQVLDLRCEVLGEDHAHTLLTRHCLARLLQRLGRTAAAETEYRTVLRHRTRILGDAHPETRKTRKFLEELC